MPHHITPLRVEPLSGALQKSSQLGAEVILPESMTLFDPKSLSDDEKATLQRGFFDHGVLVIRDQQGLDPQVLHDIAELLDPQPLHFHSGGEKQVTDPRNILSQNNCSRIPRAPQVTLIGQGHIEEYEGISELDLKHLVRRSRFPYHAFAHRLCVGPVVIS
jgi:alpha-ketoglutarate-dependent taurine dioxygenase